MGGHGSRPFLWVLGGPSKNLIWGKFVGIGCATRGPYNRKRRAEPVWWRDTGRSGGGGLRMLVVAGSSSPMIAGQSLCRMLGKGAHETACAKNNRGSGTVGTALHSLSLTDVVIDVDTKKS